MNNQTFEYFQDHSNENNYNSKNYNNYKTWINIKNGQTQISFIDEFNNIQTVNFPLHKLKIETDCKKILPKN